MNQAQRQLEYRAFNTFNKVRASAIKYEVEEALNVFEECCKNSKPHTVKKQITNHIAWICLDDISAGISKSFELSNYSEDNVLHVLFV